MTHRPSTLSLKGRALQLLAQREQSRAEMRRKLLPYAALEETGAADEPAFDDRSDMAAPERRPSPLAARRPTVRRAEMSSTAVARVDALLDWLEANNHLSEARFVESRVHSRAARHGTLRIRQELARHHVALPADTARVLHDSELSRAAAVWQRKFGVSPVDVAARARQMRFLAGRGFSAETVRRTVPAVTRGASAAGRHGEGSDDDEPSVVPDDD